LDPAHGCQALGLVLILATDPNREAAHGSTSENEKGVIPRCEYRIVSQILAPGPPAPALPPLMRANRFRVKYSNTSRTPLIPPPAAAARCGCAPAPDGG